MTVMQQTQQAKHILIEYESNRKIPFFMTTLG